MKATPNLKQRVHGARHVERAARRLRHAADQLQERALAGAISADDGHLLAARDLERDAVERRDFSPGPRAAEQAEHV